MSLEPRRAGQGDVDVITMALAGAFFEDPVWGWVFPDPDLRDDQLAAMFELFVLGAVGHRWVWTTPTHDAATVWLPPGCPEFTPEGEARLAPLLEELVGDRSSLVLELFERFEAAHPRDRDHHYLSPLGTNPRRRGAGVGMRLLGANLDELDQLGMPAYLESTNPHNLDRYRSVGFEESGVFDLPDNGPTVTTMWRRPR